MNTEITQLDVALTLIKGQTSFNALCAIECMILGLDTPLIDEFKLRCYKTSLKSLDTEQMVRECGNQKRVIHQIQTDGAHERVVGQHIMQGVRFDEVEYLPVLKEELPSQ